MGYFANSTEGDLYEDEYCAHCAHYQETKPCTVLVAHALHNYKEYNNADSILHILIPRSDDGIGNEKCRMFIPAGDGNTEICAARSLLLDAPYDRGAGTLT